MKTPERPSLNNSISVADFQDFYWLKEELVAFCRSNGINTTGGKQELANRIVVYLQTGKIVKTVPKEKTKSKFDWNNAEIDLDTAITDNYKNSENVRAFMKREIGSYFHFNTAFVKWTKQNVGKTMREAIAEWKRLYELGNDKNYQTTISSQFEYNAYIRDFLTDNKDKKLTEAINCWKWKRNQRGNNVYSKEDLKLIENASGEAESR
jgi:hypothetical protein